MDILHCKLHKTTHKITLKNFGMSSENFGIKKPSDFPIILIITVLLVKIILKESIDYMPMKKLLILDSKWRKMQTFPILNLRKIFFMWISPRKTWKLFDFFPYYRFDCTSLTGMFIQIEKNQKVTEAITYRLKHN